MKWDPVSLLGLAIVVFGILALLANAGLVSIHWYELWPLLVLGIGLAFEFAFFLNRDASSGLLLPGGILTTVGCVFLIAVLFGWDVIGELWPLFVLAPAVGFFQMYLFGGREVGLLIPAAILGAVGLIFLIVNLISSEVLGTVFPIAMIIIGGILLLNSPKRRRG